MRYRAEIDGLRAFAVIPVILFHGGFTIFSGGFVGVDVFFVISGYLITSIILSELEAKTFSIINFYERRARRILPALFLVIAATTPFAWMWLFPSEMKDFVQSIAAVSVFSSNILFWRESGYFAAAAELKPLLHTWSLAVEEQYYILFPPLLIMLWGLGRKTIAYVIFGLALISLAFAQWASINAPTFGFFMLPTRAFELLIGAMTAFYLIDKSEIKGNNALSILGCALVIYSVFAFDNQTPFPSVYALVPAIGTALIILFTSKTTLIFGVLGNRLIVGIGLISYSAYLWHQPLFAFARIKSIGEPSHVFMLFLAATSLFLAYFSWRFVENPMRRSTLLSRRSVFISALLASALFISIGIVGHIKDGWNDHWVSTHSAEIVAIKKIKDTTDNSANSQDNGDCQFNVQDMTDEIAQRTLDCFKKYGDGVAIIGDSHANDLYSVVATSNKNTPFIAGFTKGDCALHASVSGCWHTGFSKFADEYPDVFKTIIYEQAGFYLLKGNGYDVGARQMISTVPIRTAVPELKISSEFIQSAKAYLVRLSKHAKVIWFGPRIEPYIPLNYVFEVGCNYEFSLREGQASIFANLDQHLKDDLLSSGVEFISQAQFFNFDLKKDFMNCTEMYWDDGDHLSASGERRFGKRRNLLEKLAE